MCLTLRKIFFIVSMLIVVNSESFSQNSTSDKIVMINGEEKNGKVMEIGDDYIKFIYTGENLVYTLKKKDVNKIQFVSGRIEMFTEVTADSAGGTSGTSLSAHHNKVAVLPFNYIGKGGSRDDKMSNKVQSDSYNILKKSASQFFIQDPITTNALLAKHNVRPDNIAGFVPAEIAEILGVEYVMMGTITINQTATKTTGGSYGSAKSSGKKITGYTVGGSSSSADYKTSVDMYIYNDQGTNIYSKTHESFWQSEDAYTVTLQYLIKRTPLYSK